jgi:hypothetical protein
MVGPLGQENPSIVGPFLIWQQPHLVYLAELCYRAHPNRATLEEYRDLVLETAEFMASYAAWEEGRKRYVLGPPVIPMQELYRPATTWNPTFELAYWAFGLETAQRWRERLGLSRDPQWDHVLKHLSALPVKDGVYVTAESQPDTFVNRDHSRDHPSFLGSLGVLPGSGVDREAMRRTLRKVVDGWDWGRAWGTDHALTAMTAARLGDCDLAIDILLMNSPGNRYLANGHCFQDQNTLPVYLPANGSILTATAMMTAGWDGSPERNAPGFPGNEDWVVRWEGLKPMP